MRTANFSRILLMRVAASASTGLIAVDVCDQSRRQSQDSGPLGSGCHHRRRTSSLLCSPGRTGREPEADARLPLVRAVRAASERLGGVLPLTPICGPVGMVDAGRGAAVGARLPAIATLPSGREMT